MIRGFYSAATALDTLSQNQDVVAQNIANATVPGYRRHALAFESFENALTQASGNPNGASLQGTQTSRYYTVFDQGELQKTGNTLDVAIKGDAFFVLEGPSGPLYTRNGSFELSADGEVRSASGLPVTGQGGKLAIPRETKRISIAEDGTVLADNVPVGKLQLARFDNLDALIPAGTTLFEAPPSAGQQAGIGAGTVHQGYREGSNVQIVNEMVAMIAGMRQYEAAQKALLALSDSVGLNTRPQAG
jgi:flagellar basal-body rod protein FlgF